MNPINIREYYNKFLKNTPKLTKNRKTPNLANY